MLSERTIPAWAVAVITFLAGVFLRIIPQMPKAVKIALSWPFFSFSVWYAIFSIFGFAADLRTVIIRANILALCAVVILTAHVAIQRVGGYRALCQRQLK